MGEIAEPQLLQLKYRSEPWKLLVACILLNRTSRRQVDGVIDDLFLDYPTPEALSQARERDLSELLHPLGMQRNRATRLIAFAEDWIALDFMWQGTTPNGLTELSALTGVGDYALDSYRMFVLNDRTVDPTDKELRRWKAWFTSGSA
jgi:methyl-CpG-binding domain protein 4